MTRLFWNRPAGAVLAAVAAAFAWGAGGYTSADEPKSPAKEEAAAKADAAADKLEAARKAEQAARDKVRTDVRDGRDTVRDDRKDIRDDRTKGREEVRTDRKDIGTDRSKTRDAVSGDRKDVRDDRTTGRETVRDDRKDIRTDRTEGREAVRDDRKDIRDDRSNTRDKVGDDRKDVRNDRSDTRETVRDDRKDIRTDRTEGRDAVRDDRKDVRDDRQGTRDEVRGDRKDVRGDRGDNRSTVRDDREGVRDARRDVRGARREFVVNRIRSGDLGLWLRQMAGNTGVQVSDVSANSAMSSAGLREGDQIVSINGQPVTSERQFVDTLFADHEKAATVIVTRGGKQTTLTMNPQDFVKEYESAESDPLIAAGIIVDDRNGDKIVVHKVLPQSSAYYSGLRSGDTITSARGQRLTALVDLIKALANTNGTATSVEVNRGNQTRQLDIEVPGAGVHTTLKPNTDSPNLPAAAKKPVLTPPGSTKPALPPATVPRTNQLP